MHLINIERLIKITRAALHPLLIRESEFIEISYDRREIRTQLHSESIGVAVLNPAVSAVNDIFVHLPCPGALYSDLKELSALGLRHFFFLPAVELADDRDALRLRRESPKDHSVLLHMRAQISVRVIDFTHVEFLKIHYSPLLFVFVLFDVCRIRIILLHFPGDIQYFLCVVHSNAHIFADHTALVSTGSL